MPSKKAGIKYPGWLGKPIPVSREYCKAVLSGSGAFNRWLLGQREKAMQKLLEFYEIPSGTAAARWNALAWRLALDHVPAMRVRDAQGPGRPPTALLASAERALADLDSSPRKRGRPTKWDDEIRLALVEWIDQIKADAAARSERLSDNAALDELLREKARSQGTALLKVSRKSKAFIRWRKQLQIARKKFPQTSTH